MITRLNLSSLLPTLTRKMALLPWEYLARSIFLTTGIRLWKGTKASYESVIAIDIAGSKTPKVVYRYK